MVAASCIWLTLGLAREPLCPLSRPEEPLPSHVGVSPAGDRGLGRKPPKTADCPVWFETIRQRTWSERRGLGWCLQLWVLTLILLSLVPQT